MNPFKIAFILCTNSELYLNECLHYLNLLHIPDGYETEILTIYDAKSLASGYNEGMLSTDAKYKVYLHQDVFIINHNFLDDIISIFESVPSIGMIGLVGYTRVSSTGIMWKESRLGANPLYGTKHAYPHADYYNYHFSLSDGLANVALIDGLLMATAYDLPWDTNILKDWDFYDAFQSMNYLLHGYRIVVPIQTLPWFIHEDGHQPSMWNYNKYRKIFMEKYSKYLGKTCTEIIKMQ